jgi:ribosomal protein S27E
MSKQVELIKVKVQKEGFDLICPRCKHRWIYAGKKQYNCTCPSCHTTISFSKQMSQTGGQKYV